MAIQLITIQSAKFLIRHEPIPIKFLLAFEIIFSLGARTGSENKRAILVNIALLFLRTPRGKELEIESKIFIGIGSLGGIRNADTEVKTLTKSLIGKLSGSKEGISGNAGEKGSLSLNKLCGYLPKALQYTPVAVAARGLAIGCVLLGRTGNLSKPTNDMSRKEEPSALDNLSEVIDEVKEYLEDLKKSPEANEKGITHYQNELADLEKMYDDQKDQQTLNDISIAIDAVKEYLEDLEKSPEANEKEITHYQNELADLQERYDDLRKDKSS
jgi:hypothetical protein